MKKSVIAIVALTLIYYWITHRTDSMAYDCVRSKSPDGRYVAEECTLDWDHGDNPKYVGRLYDDVTGKMLARRTLHAPDPEILWVANYLMFSGGGNDEDMIALPPSLYDRIVATYWQLTKW